MTKIAYIQSIGGASGDMLLGALVDAGLPLDTLRSELAKLPVDGYAIDAAEETRCEVRGVHLKVSLEDRTRYSPAVLLRTVETSPLAPAVKEQADEVLRALWRAEARVHGEPEETLDLEELGSVDTLVDVVGFCIGLRQLGVEELYAAPLVLGEPSPPRRTGGYSQPRAGHAGADSHVGRAGGRRQPGSCRGWRADHADRRRVDYHAIRVSPPRLLRAKGGRRVGYERPAGFRQRSARVAGGEYGTPSP